MVIVGFNMKCPECGKNLGKGVQDTLTSISWSCYKCNIKIYKNTAG